MHNMNARTTGPPVSTSEEESLRRALAYLLLRKLNSGRGRSGGAKRKSRCVNIFNWLIINIEIAFRVFIYFLDIDSLINLRSAIFL